MVFCSIIVIEIIAQELNQANAPHYCPDDHNGNVRIKKSGNESMI